MEAIILEPKNIDELHAVKKAVKEIGISSFTISDSEKKYLSKLKKATYAKGKYIDPELEQMNKKVSYNLQSIIWQHYQNIIQKQLHQWNK